VSITKFSDTGHILMEWNGNSVNDMVADSVMSIILQAESSPAAVKATSSKCTHSHDHGAKTHVKDEDVPVEIALDGDGIVDNEVPEVDNEMFKVYLSTFLKSQFGESVQHIQKKTAGDIANDDDETQSEEEAEEGAIDSDEPAFIDLQQDIKRLQKAIPEAELWNVQTAESKGLVVVESAKVQVRLISLCELIY
jgi:Pre-mRNA 3'-end-processing endonuclease polyadenylation factor C-term